MADPTKLPGTRSGRKLQMAVRLSPALMGEVNDEAKRTGASLSQMLVALILTGLWARKTAPAAIEARAREAGHG